jgi:hypothetical protein
MIEDSGVGLICHKFHSKMHQLIVVYPLCARSDQSQGYASAGWQSMWPTTQQKKHRSA